MVEFGSGALVTVEGKGHRARAKRRGERQTVDGHGPSRQPSSNRRHVRIVGKSSSRGAYVQVGSGVRIVRIERFHTLVRHLCRTQNIRSPWCLPHTRQALLFRLGQLQNIGATWLATVGDQERRFEIRDLFAPKKSAAFLFSSGASVLPAVRR